MKIGFDIHGVIDQAPEFFALITGLLVDAGHEVHIVTGQREKEITPKLKEMGIKWTHFFSITDYHEKLGTEVIYSEKGPWMAESVWNKSKGEYAQRVGLDMHFDDSEKYKLVFFNPLFLLKQEGKMIKLKFKDGWTSPHWEDRSKVNHYRKLNGIEAEIFYSNYPQNFPEKFCACVEFVGGFTDEYFFLKEEIKSLTDADLVEFIKTLKKINKK